MENLDREMIRKVFQCPFSTPVEAGHLELGLLPLSCIVKERRVNYLHYILKSEKSQMLYKFFTAQWETPTKHDWTETVKCDLIDLGIRNDLSYLESKTQIFFKNLVKARIKEFALDMLNESKYEHSKMDNLLFTELKIQEYLVAENISVEQKRNILRFRTRMATFSENYRGQEPQKPCQICGLHVDSQEHSVSCVKTMQNVNKNGKYCEIFSRNISCDTAVMLEQIMKNGQNNLG